MIKCTLLSQNKKLVGEPGKNLNWSAAPIASTMREVGRSCPSSCGFLNNGCYSQAGPMHWQSKKATVSADDAETLKAFILKLPEGTALRHHTGGDLFLDDKPDTALIDAMLEAHVERPDIKAWGYTHGAAQLAAAGYTADKMQVGGLVMNASCDSAQEAREAFAAGWPVVFTVASSDTRKTWYEGEMRVVTCPNQSLSRVRDGVPQQGPACNACMLCASQRDYAIAFRHHGSGAKKADRRLEELTPLPMASD